MSNSDTASGFAGNPRNPREAKGRPPPDPELKDGDLFIEVQGIERRLERDPAFPPSENRLAGHSLTVPALIAAITGFRSAGFLPNAVSRLVKLHPDDINTIAPNSNDTEENPDSRPAPGCIPATAAPAKRRPGRPRKSTTAAVARPPDRKDSAYD